MEHPPLTAATQAVLDALAALGRGTVHELADRAGKTRSTTDKAIRTLADAGLVVTVDTDTDPADDAPIRWTLAIPPEAADTPLDDTDVDSIDWDEADLGDPELDHVDDEPYTSDSEQADNDDLDTTDDGANPQDAARRADGEVNSDDDADPHQHDKGRTAPAVQVTRPGDRKVMAIKGVLADHADDGATLDLVVAESGIGHVTASRLLAAMEQADAARRAPGVPPRWIPGPTRASEVDPNPRPTRCPLCQQVIRARTATPNVTAEVAPLVRPDGTLHVVGPDGDLHVITLPARATGVAQPAGGRGNGDVNADGSPPFGRGELERLTLDVLAAHPGQAMSPQDIATVIGGQLGRTVSSGAVRNNCTKAAAGGRILLVSETPLTFTHPRGDSGTGSGAASADPS